jgi:hypothetical protein
MLSELQRTDLWERWLAAEMRANYFADMASRFSFRQSFLVWLTLLASSGAAAALVSDWVPKEFAWIKPALAFLAAGLSLLNLVFQNQKKATESSDLHFHWNRLACEYEDLWGDIYSESAADTLAKLREKGRELSKSGVSAGIGYNERIMLKWENHVLQHRVQSQHAA